MIQFFKKKQSLSENLRFFDFFFAPAVLLIILLVGHYGFFIGHTLFIDEDPLTVSGYHAGDKQVGGWRPDFGLGMTYFFADPGSQHTWSAFRWWHQLFSNDVLAYNVSVLILMWAACMAQYSFLRVAVPNLNRVVAVLLSSILAFGPLRYEMFFIRSSAMMPISAVLLALVLRKFYEQPLRRYYFNYTLVMALSLFLGSSACLLQAIFFSIAFFLVQVCYQYFYEESRDFLKPIKNYIILNLTSGISIFILGGWTFYSIFLEGNAVGYVRDPDYSVDSFFISPSLHFIVNRFLMFLHAGLISLWSGVLGIKQMVLIHSGYNVSPVFPVVCLMVLFHKSRNFWEFSAKVLVLGFLFYMEICSWVPGILWLIQSVLNLYPPLKMYPFIMGFEILFIAVLIDRLGSKEININLTAQKVSRGFALFISPIYAVLLATALMAIVAPQSLNDLLQTFLSAFSPAIGSEGKVEFLSTLIFENVQLFNATMGWSQLLFYGTTFVLLVSLGTKYWPQNISRDKGRLFALALSINAILLSWAVYPLNKEPLIWDEQAVNSVPLAETFAPTDRLTRVYGEKCRGRSDYLDCIKNKFFLGEFGPRRYRVGYTQVPTLEFSAKKSFSQKEAAKFIDAFMEKENVPLEGVRRYLQSRSSIYSSRLFDIAAVNLVLSTDPVSGENGLELIHKGAQFYLYRNLRAWPYYYFAERVETIGSFKDLYEGERGVGYIWAEDTETVIPAELHDADSQLFLEKFIPGEMEFQYTSKKSEFLVIADSWHPNWRVQVDGNETKLIQANGVFKGVLLPLGSHRVRLFFDSSVYLPGVWISMVGWVLFAAGWAWMVLYRDKRENSLKI